MADEGDVDVFDALDKADDAAIAAVWFHNDMPGEPPSAEAFAAGYDDPYSWPAAPFAEADARLAAVWQALGRDAVTARWSISGTVRERIVLQPGDDLPAGVLTMRIRAFVEPRGAPGAVSTGQAKAGAPLVAVEEPEGFGAFTLAEVHDAHNQANQVQPDATLPHPLTPLLKAWVAIPRPAKPYPVRWRGSLPRFDRVTLDEARLLASVDGTEPSGQYSLLHTDDVVDSCSTWLLAMYEQARSNRTGRKLGSTRGGLPWSFVTVIGGVAHLAIADRRMLALNGYPLPFNLSDVIGWIHPEGWPNRVRDWAKLDDAFNETQSYRVTAPDPETGELHRYWVVSAYGLPAIYSPEATVKLDVRVPPSAASGARFDWPRFLHYAKRATMQRAVLSVATYLDRTAENGHPLTRLVREPVLDADGKPKRERIIGKDGKPKRGKSGRYLTRPLYVPGKLAPNPRLSHISPALLPDKHLALFLGLADGSSNRRNAREALETLQADGAIDLERVRNGYRIFGPPPEPKG